MNLLESFVLPSEIVEIRVFFFRGTVASVASASWRSSIQISEVGCVDATGLVSHRLRWFSHQEGLVGGLEHVFFLQILGIIIPIDIPIFQRSGSTSNQFHRFIIHDYP